jgi:mono/diheme cytochrome c family protein
MRPNEEDSTAPLGENPVVRRRGRELVKLLGTVVVALVGLALACRSLWDFRDEWPSSTAPAARGPRDAVAASDLQPLAVGHRVYQARCVRCHGQNGHGDGPELAKSQVRPRDLASSSWHSGADRDTVRRVILEGTPDKSMPGSAAVINPRELDSVVDYVFSLEVSDLLMRVGIAFSMGEIAPPLSFRDAEGTVGSLDQFRGKVVLVAFWGNDLHTVHRGTSRTGVSGQPVRKNRLGCAACLSGRAECSDSPRCRRAARTEFARLC